MLRDWRESLVLQCVRLLTEAEPVLVWLAELESGDAALSAGDRLKLDRLAASRADIVAISARIKKLDAQIPALLKAMGCSLTTIHGIGVVTAMTLLTEVGDPLRFSTEGRFARWCGVAPVAMSSGEGDGPPRNHRLDLGGNRRVNSVLHIVHVTQARCHPEAQSYLLRREGENKTKRAARRAHKRQLANIIIRRMWNDADDLAHANSTPQRRPLDKRAWSPGSASVVTTPRTSNGGATGWTRRSPPWPPTASSAVVSITRS